MRSMNNGIDLQLIIESIGGSMGSMGNCSPIDLSLNQLHINEICCFGLHSPSELGMSDLTSWLSPITYHCIVAYAEVPMYPLRTKLVVLTQQSHHDDHDDQVDDHHDGQNIS